ncbi:metallophosphoesterase family protein [Exiguobacterium sp. s193]|uniref:metallophosphoesterase family protein n=1 Tax=Exiguobacterium sp. s193 TaxID=2751207 RepID=UPI001BE5DC29|nr:metallophosphoesterase family protein [Exiguobacterium sp. s193]
MKFAVITDIHGNAAALKAVFDTIDQNPEIETIYCLGDLVGIGAETNEVIELIRRHDKVRTISGNHDENVLALLHDERYPDSYLHAKAHHEWVADQLTPENRVFLERLPRTILKTVETQQILFTHYAYRDVRAMIGEEPLRPTVDGNKETLPQLFADTSATLICFGHHHPRQFVQVKGTTYVNPGALGCQPEAVAPFAIVTGESGKWGVAFIDLPYDDAAYLEAFNASDMPAKELLRKLFLGGRS